MTAHIGEQHMMQNPTTLSARRLTLMASIAGVGLAVLLAGLGTLPATHTPRFTSSASAAENVLAPSGFADIVAKVKPAVISVRVRFDVERSASNDNSMQRGLRQFGFPNGLPGLVPHNETVAAEGSGFFISADGYAVTNNHVVDHAKSVQVVTDDGKILVAKVIGTDPKTDLALIKVDGNNFRFVKFANRDPRIGDWVIAVGNPFGLGGTVTAGVVSARDRDIGSGPYDDYIQIDAPVNKGNSGGPSFDVNGNVIGVNTAIFSPSGGSVGIGFDIPAQTVKAVVAQLKDIGHVTRGWIGVQIQSVTPDIANSLGLQKAAGAIVDEPQADSPAATAGIMSGDVFTALDGNPVKDSHTLARKIGAMAPGTSVKLGVLRNGSEKTMTLTLGTLPDERQADATPQKSSDSGMPHLGLTLAPANAVGEGTQGVAVIAVDPTGPAADRGIQSGDVILGVAGKRVSSPSDVSKEIADLHKAGKHTALMLVKSNNGIKVVAIPFGNA
jgi:serine protease Do